MRPPGLRAALLLAALLLLLAACAEGTDDPPVEDADDAPAATPEDDEQDAAPEDADAPTPDDAPMLRVVATVAPLADIVEQVTGDRAEVTSLVPEGADSHTYEPTPEDAADLEHADLYVGNGLALNEGALQLAERTLPEGARLLRLGEDALTEEDLADAPAHDHEHEHDHEHDDGHDQERAPNPHTWMTPTLVMPKVDRLHEVLTELDPDGEAVYREQAVAFQRELAVLDEAIAEAADTVPPDDRVVVTFHDAYGYFVADYGFEVVGAVQPSDFSEPSAGEVAELIEQIRAEDVPAVFGSEVFPDDVLETIADESGATYYGDLADDVLPDEDSEFTHSYIGLMERNAVTIIDGLGGDASAITER